MAATEAAHLSSMPKAYKQRNAVERCINRLKQWRGLAMQTDKLAIAYQVALHLAAILIWTQR
ncbi:transposase [Nonomuraea africana]|uniref:transposase n=1 Tax=Nonomuraea africana TaxID=46171 RepID=UPI0033E66D60